MDTLNINNREFNLSSPTGSEYQKQYIESFGDEFKDKIAIRVNVNSNSVDGYFLEMDSNLASTFNVEFMTKMGN